MKKRISLGSMQVSLKHQADPLFHTTAQCVKKGISHLNWAAAEHSYKNANFLRCGPWNIQYIKLYRCAKKHLTCVCVSICRQYIFVKSTPKATLIIAGKVSMCHADLIYKCNAVQFWVMKHIKQSWRRNKLEYFTKYKKNVHW